MLEAPELELEALPTLPLEQVGPQELLANLISPVVLGVELLGKLDR